MFDALLASCRWLEETPWGAAIRASSWMFPIVLWVHLVGLCIWFGTSLAVDLRLMGVGARRQTAVELSNDLFTWNWIGFGVAFVAGFLLLSAEATTYASNVGFWLKLGLLTPLALIWHITVQRNTAAWVRGGRKGSVIGRCAGAIELLLWVSVVAAAVVFLLTNAVTHA